MSTIQYMKSGLDYEEGWCYNNVMVSISTIIISIK